MQWLCTVEVYKGIVAARHLAGYIISVALPVGKVYNTDGLEIEGGRPGEALIELREKQVRVARLGLMQDMLPGAYSTIRHSHHKLLGKGLGSVRSPQQKLFFKHKKAGIFRLIIIALPIQGDQALFLADAQLPHYGLAPQ